MTRIRSLALLAAAALCTALLPLGTAGAQPGEPAPEQPTDRRVIDLDGTTTVDYAIRWSQVTHPDTALTGGDGPIEALIGRSDAFADSLASGPLQADGSPLLLTAPSELSADTLAELDRLEVDGVTVLGGEGAIEPAVVEALQAEGYPVTRRLAGGTRIETAVAVAQAVDAEAAAAGAANDTAIIARAFGSDAGDETQAWADSLSAGGWAAEAGYPVLLTDSTDLSDATAAHIQAAGYDTLIIVGGEAAVSTAVQAELQTLATTVTRVGGINRFETAVDVAEARGLADADGAEGILLVDGSAAEAWADGFAAAALSGMGWPVVLSNSNATELPAETLTYLQTFDGTVDDTPTPAHLAGVVLICGSSVPDGREGSSSDQCGEAATALDGTVEEFQPPAGDVEGPVLTGATEAQGTLTVAYNEGVIVLGQASDYYVVGGRSATGCGGNVLFTATAIQSTDGDESIILTLDGDPTLDTEYVLCSPADVVEDREGNRNLSDSVEFIGRE